MVPKSVRPYTYGSSKIYFGDKVGPSRVSGWEASGLRPKVRLWGFMTEVKENHVQFL